MIMDDLLKIEPQVLSFPHELNKQVSCRIRLSNITRKGVAFKVMTTDPKKYTVRPSWGIILPGSCLDVIVTTHCLKALPPDQQCADKFKINSVFASPHATTEDDVRKLLDEKAGGHVLACKLGVIFTSPSQVPSLAAEESASSSIASGTEYTNSSDSDLKMDVKKLLDITPSELQFPFELNKEFSCLLRLANMTENHVFFKVKATHPQKYSVQPKVGIVFPRSTCDVIVRMHPQTKIPVDKECKDKFLIQSIVGSPRAINELTPKMFDEPGRFVEEFKLRVVYTFPSRQQSSTNEKLEAGSSSNASTLPNINSNDHEVTQELDRNESNVGPLFMKGITIGLLGLIFWYIMMKMLPLIWYSPMAKI
ncbi:VAMP-associated protein involved in inositol metabolism [Handroanthus impetiginosus]|uniref:VAMP-associated protein involved in inositol metabolism n=1 Tax=Handroanthus impetiginosus TaxID=429701 RepID=A0A2G9GQU0_9LAMI|nr:VAMP-associated protein involved in inositol metabolism [Handroanthus impetiginosus]